MSLKDLTLSTMSLQIELERLMENIRMGMQRDIPTSYLMELNKRVSGLQAVVAVQLKMIQRLVK